MAKKHIKEKHKNCPFQIIIDTNEQAPWRFTGMSTVKGVPLIVDCVDQWIETGDYSIVGLEDRITIERKSVSDLFGTVGGGRERFCRELDRMRTFEYSAVIVEGGWADIAVGNYENKSELEFLASVINDEFYEDDGSNGISPKSVANSVLSLGMDYPAQWILASSRRHAEVMCFWLLNRFWRKYGDTADGLGNTATGAELPTGRT